MPAEIAELPRRRARIGLIDTPDGEVFVQPLVPPLRIVVAGATHIGQVFAELARQVGYAVTVVDPRSVFATEERFGAGGGDDRVAGSFVRQAWASIVRTAVVALTHASHIDDEALTAALRSPVPVHRRAWLARTHAKRLERLAAAGFSAGRAGSASMLPSASPSAPRGRPRSPCRSSPRSSKWRAVPADGSIAAVVLAAGASRRFGVDNKLLRASTAAR